ncbi:hypothetical protein FRC04_008750 [Tulasnella sp. 424]|nr:hypothetical protein FRC04_008750 [Tulasnella sp. 424]KAG8979980.1 hypothetical protein FRC05_007423 [Tulasnella sp. 425]
MSDNHSVFGAPDGQNHFWMHMYNAFAKRKLVSTNTVKVNNERANEGWIATVNVGGKEYKHGPSNTKSEAKEGVAQKVLADLDEPEAATSSV